MVRRRPDTVVFDWKEVGTYSETTGRRVEGAVTNTFTIQARIDDAKMDFTNVSGEKVPVYKTIYADLRELQGRGIPSNAYVTFNGERKEVVKVETLQTHVLIWV